MSNLDPGQSYCFVVVAYIPSRPKATQQGALSKQLCIQRSTDILQGTWTPLTLHDNITQLRVYIAVVKKMLQQNNVHKLLKVCNSNAVDYVQVDRFLDLELNCL